MRYPTGALKQWQEAPEPTDAYDKTSAQLNFSAAIIYWMVARRRLRKRWMAVSGRKTRMIDVCLTQTLTLVTADQTVKMQILSDRKLYKGIISKLMFCGNNTRLTSATIWNTRWWWIDCDRSVAVRLSASLVTAWCATHCACCQASGYTILTTKCIL